MGDLLQNLLPNKTFQDQFAKMSGSRTTAWNSFRMKKAAGVSDIDEVVRRFETQEETAKHLQELQVAKLVPDMLEDIFQKKILIFRFKQKEFENVIGHGSLGYRI